MCTFQLSRKLPVQLSDLGGPRCAPRLGRRRRNRRHHCPPARCVQLGRRPRLVGRGRTDVRQPRRRDAPVGRRQPDAAGAFPVTVEHALGSTTIESEPQRVVVLGDFADSTRARARGHPRRLRLHRRLRDRPGAVEDRRRRRRDRPVQRRQRDRHRAGRRHGPGRDHRHDVPGRADLHPAQCAGADGRRAVRHHLAGPSWP